MRDNGTWWWSGSILVTVALVVFWVLLLTTVVLAVRYLQCSAATGTIAAGGPRHAETLLAERFARGEIDDGEYQRKLALLHQHR
ncbi:hypothetical protein AO501_29050 [Mycobacterium gordonae]|uniref:SHOCT domain-containing protein n=2 Tax=Mycobacterium gordonae TaxID=1778 RepID=A0A0Q2LKA2_MYCGO|nr:hypothetical protein AO501_29050 [Mycobacterium gordonae]